MESDEQLPQGQQLSGYLQWSGSYSSWNVVTADTYIHMQMYMQFVYCHFSSIHDIPVEPILHGKLWRYYSHQNGVVSMLSL